jgi:hypothetical protein
VAPEFFATRGTPEGASVGFGQKMFNRAEMDEVIQEAANLRNNATVPAEPPESALTHPPATSAPSSGRPLSLTFRRLLVQRGREHQRTVVAAAPPPAPSPHVSAVSDAQAAHAAPQRKRQAAVKECQSARKSAFKPADPATVKRQRTAIGLNKAKPAMMSEERRQQTATAAQILAKLHFPSENLVIPNADPKWKETVKDKLATVEWAKLNFTYSRVDGALDEMHKQRLKAMMKKDTGLR